MIRATFNQDFAGRFLNGIPARDLSEDEYQRLKPSQRRLVRLSALYEVKTDREMAELKKAEATKKPERVAPKPDAPTDTEEAD